MINGDRESSQAERAGHLEPPTKSVSVSPECCYMPESSILTGDNLTGYLDNTSYYILLDLSLKLNA